MLRFELAVIADFSASATVTVKLIVPTIGPVGVPVIAPVAEFSARPAGRLPVVIAHEYGMMPPTACKVWL